MANSRISTSSIVQGFPKSRSVLAGNDAIYAGSYESIATTTVGSTAVSSVTFSSIPSTYTHLQLRISARGNSGTYDWGFIKINSATSGTSHYVLGNGAAVDSNSYLNSAQPLLMHFSGASATSGIFSLNVLDFLDYTNTNKNKTVKAFGGVDANGSGVAELSSYLYSTNTNAITSIEIVGWAVGSFVQYSTFALYGIK